MVQSPEASSFLVASTARKRRLEDLLAETPNDLKFLRETTIATAQSHQASSSSRTTTHAQKCSLFLAPKFTTTTSPHNTTTTAIPKLKSAIPKLSYRTSPSTATTTTQAPKLKRLRASSPPIEMEDYDDYMHTSQDNPVEVPLGLGRVLVAAGGTPRCHVCSRVQSFATSFATVTNCGRCDGFTCYVCTRRCDSCDVTVCSGCAEEEGVYCFCKGCLEGEGMGI